MSCLLFAYLLRGEPREHLHDCKVRNLTKVLTADEAMTLQASRAAMNFSRNSQLLISAKQPSQASSELYVRCALGHTEHAYTSHAYSTRRGTYTEMKGAHPRHPPVLSFFFCHHTRKTSISASGSRRKSSNSLVRSPLNDWLRPQHISPDTPTVAWIPLLTRSS